VSLEKKAPTIKKEAVVITGSHESMAFRSLEVVRGIVAYNFLFRVERLCAKLFVLVELRDPEAPIDVSIDLAALKLAQTAAFRCAQFLEDPAKNVLTDDWPELGRPLSFFGIQSQVKDDDSLSSEDESPEEKKNAIPSPRPGEGRAEAAAAALAAKNALYGQGAPYPMDEDDF